MVPYAHVLGAELYYEEFGDGPPLILTPGGVQNGVEVIRDLAELLSGGRRVIAYDRRFAGRSRSRLTVQTWNLATDDLIGLLDYLDIPVADLGGGATGAAISIRCAARHPSRVRRVFASNVNGGLMCTSLLMMPFIKSMEIALTKGMNALVESYDSSDRYAPFVPAFAVNDAEFRAEFVTIRPDDFADVMRRTVAELFEGDFVGIALTESVLRSVTAPCLLLHGPGDDIHPRRVAERVGELLENVRWSDVGSFRRPENRALFAEEVSRFLDPEVAPLPEAEPAEADPAKHARHQE
jgi:pimeloyl-ACP methyl ester carboxylesterase